MADLGQAGEVGSRLLSRLVTGGIMAILALLIGGLILTVALIVRYYRQFNIKVRIKAKRGEQDGRPIYKTFYDRGGVLYKKNEQRSYFRILRERIDLPVPPFEAIQILADGGNEMEIRKESDTEYYYEVPGKIEKGFTMKDGKMVPISKQNAKVIEGDVAYWNIVRKRENKKLFDTESTLMKLLPYGILIAMTLGVIFYTYIWMDKAPAIISAGQQVAEALKEAAQALRDANTAQVITG